MTAKNLRLDLPLLGGVATIAAASLLMLGSSSPDLFIKQLIFLGLGTIIALILFLVDLRPLVGAKWAVAMIFFGSLLSLVAVHLFGTEVNGSKSWLGIGTFGLQPSELSKFALITILAAFFSRRHIGIRRIAVILGSFAYFAALGILIITEPDLGSALILFGIWFGFLLVAGLPIRYVAFAAVLCLAFGGVAWNVALKDYQKDRIMAVFNPEADPLGVNYNVIQSKSAIGSAGTFGKGFGQGALVKLGYLPAAQTDFAFSSFTEEWGFAGAMIVLAAFGIIIWRIAVIGVRAEGNFYKLFCLGSMIFFGLHFFVNIGSALGLLPVIGVVFPFLSSGGSNLIISMAIIGVIQNIAVRNSS